MRSPEPTVCVCVFAKPPRAGEVKTRLAASYGEHAASELARAFLTDSWQGANAPAWALSVLALTSTDRSGLPELVPEPTCLQQGEGDLGARIERILRGALELAPAAIAIGADTPGLPACLLEDARAALEHADAVIGPAEDGGFYLLGVRRCPEGLLAELPWSGPDTCARTLARLRSAGMSVVELASWFDVDRPSDLERLRTSIERGEITAPATARTLPRVAGRISVVIPTLNEEKRIAARLRELAQAPSLHEVIVVDGGSTDATVTLARDAGVAHVLRAPRGRASQMNAGARAATGEILLFAHADASLPADVARWVRSTLSDPRTIAGAFRTWTVDDTREAPPEPARERALVRSLWLHLADLRSRLTSLPYGDQALFVRAEDFHAIGGYPEQPLMEDFELSRRLRRRGRIQTAEASVRVSGRRFLRRPLHTFLAMSLYPLLYRAGVPTHVLARVYGNPR